MIEHLVEMYEKGAITADHLAVECLHRIDPGCPENVLQLLPSAALERILTFAREYRPGKMRANYGPQPAADQVESAMRWIESKAQELRLCV